MQLPAPARECSDAEIDACARIDLQRFCANDLDPREYLRSPWKRGAWVFATNGHLAIRVPSSDYPDVPETTAKVPDVGAFFDKHMSRDCEFLLMPPVPKLAPCLDCSGKGKVRAIKCTDCTDGEFRHGNYFYTCKNCDESPAGAGWEHLSEDDDDQPHEVVRTCQECYGLGFPIRNSPMQVGEAHYSAVYLAMFSALPHVRICPGAAPRVEYEPAKEVPAVFTFSGGHGLLMPTRP